MCLFTHLAQPGLAVLSRALTWQHILPKPFYTALGESGDHAAEHEFAFIYHQVQPICRSISRCFRKTICIYKVCLLRFQTFLSGCLASLPMKEPLYCNLFKIAVLLSLTDHFICLKTTLHGKNKKVDLFLDASRKNLIDVC